MMMMISWIYEQITHLGNVSMHKWRRGQIPRTDKMGALHALVVLLAFFKVPSTLFG